MAVAQPLPALAHDAHHPYMSADLDWTALLPTHRVDLRTISAPDTFFDQARVDWNALRWEQIGRPYRVQNWSREKARWEAAHGGPMPIQTAWEHFNRSFHSWFVKDVPAELSGARRKLLRAALRWRFHEFHEECMELIQLAYWNKLHRAEDAVWDPRGKRALFSGLDLQQPRVLFLGAADGYEAMQLAAMYPGGHTVLVDYDDFCRTDRFGKFPEAYPFVGSDPATGGPRVWYRDQMHIDFEVEDIRNLKYGREFDVVISIGLIEHFPDEYKPLAFEMHRRFLKPGGYTIMTTPRRRWQSKLFYFLMQDTMNFSYRELMDVQQLGLYAHENGFKILRAGTTKGHNGVIAQAR